MNLLERDAFVAAFGHYLRESAAGQGSMLFLGGEAGVGKTTLSHHFRQGLGPSARAFTGVCDPLSTPRPLGPLVDIADAMHGDVARQLAAGAPRDQVFRAFLGALAAGSAPTLIVFEDVHWADEATLDLLRFLGRRIATTRAFLLATYRDDEVGPTHPLRIVLGDLATAASVHRRSLSPLSAQAVRTLAEGSDLDPDELYRQTAGNPFFVTEVLAGGGQGIPATVRDAVLARAARLSPAGRATLEAAAVIGPRSEPWRRAAVAGTAADAVDECLALGVLQADADGFHFRHELARQAILSVLSPQRSAGLHRLALAALRSPAAGAAEPARLAHHAEAAGDRDAVLEYAVAAAHRAVELRAHREAMAQYARALRFAADLPLAERATLQEAHAYECYLTENLAESIEARRAALATWREVGDQLKVGDNLRWLSRVYWFTGRNAEAEAAAREALAVLEQLPPGPEFAMACSNQAQLRMLADDTEEAIAWGERAIALALELGEREILVHALNNVGSAMTGSGEEHGWDALERSLRLALDDNLEEHVGRAYSNLSSGAVKQYRFALADRYLSEGITYCAERDLDSWRLYLLSQRVASYFAQGRWSEAAQTAAAILRHPNVSAISRVLPLATLGRIRARRGDPDVAAVLDEALALASRIGELQRVGPVRTARAEAAWLAGDAAAARDEARAALDLAIAHQEPWFTGELIYWQWRAGETVAPPPWLALPYSRQIAGDWAGAAAEWERLGCPYEAARALSESDDEAALRRALASFEQLGARPMAQFVARRLRESGVRAIPRGPRPTTRANAAGLTQREIEIVGLIAADLRNAEIATRLSLSPKTIEHHISAIFAKLGARSRAEAVRAATQLDLLP
ncbi:MAG: LuxR C-terminal-related transcriptional regulator [Thermomicrobiales bacterium]